MLPVPVVQYKATVVGYPHRSYYHRVSLVGGLSDAYEWRIQIPAPIRCELERSDAISGVGVVTG